MSIMHFIPRLTEFLRNNGTIYTLRKYKYTTPRCSVPGVGECRRTLIREMRSVSEEDLRTTVTQSGFPNTTSWLKMLRTFVPDPNTLVFMYKVEVI